MPSTSIPPAVIRDPALRPEPSGVVMPMAGTPQLRALRLTIALLSVGVGWACLPFAPGLLGAAMLCVVLAPVYRVLAPRVGARGAALILSAAATVALVLPAVALLTAVMPEVPGALERLMSSQTLAWLSKLRVGPLDVGAQLADVGRNLVSWGTSNAMSAAAGMTRMVLNLFLAILGLYYLLPSASALWGRVRRSLPISRAGADHLGERFVSVTEAALLGIVFTGITQGLTVGLAFRLVGLSNPLVWGVVTGIVSILPVFGSSLVWLPGTVVLVAEGRIGAAVALGLIGLVISSNVDNVVRPIIYRRVSGLHPMVSLVGAFAGVELLGLVGLLIGPLALAYCIELYRLHEIEAAAGTHERSQL